MFLCVLYYLDAFGAVWLPYKTRCKTGRSGAKVRAMKSCQNFSLRTYPSTPLNPKLMFHSVLYYFLCNWHRSVALQNSVQNGLTWWKSSCHEVASEFFATYTPDPPHWTLNSCFVVFCTIWVHLVPFGYLTKLGAKRAEVVQNFGPWSRVGIFHNNPLDPPH